MRNTGILLGTCLIAASAMAAKLPNNHVRGEYLEARTADVYTGPCFANGEVGQTGKLAVMGWHIEQGSFDGVQLDGLNVIGVLRANDTIGDFALTSNPAKSVIIFDEKASPEQQLALRGFAQQMAGELLANVVRTDVQPIEFNMQDGSVHSRAVSLTAGNLAKISTRALQDSDQVCHNEGVWYQPMVKMDHAMPAFTTGNAYSGNALGETWSYPEKRGSFVGTFDFRQ